MCGRAPTCYVEVMLRSLVRMLFVPDKLAMLGLMRGMRRQTLVASAVALLELDLWPSLQEPQSFEDIVEIAGATETEVLEHLLDLGVCLALLRSKKGTYQARPLWRFFGQEDRRVLVAGLRKELRTSELARTADALRREETPAATNALARAVARDASSPLASMLKEVTSYHLEVFENLPARVRGQAPRDYLTRFGALVAQSSRIMAPWICAFTAAIVGRDRGHSILELGCGSGAYLEFYASLHGEHRGVGLDFDEAVVRDARAAMDCASLAARFEVMHADMRDASSWPDERFDVVTAHQNVYYFTPEERAAIWRNCRRALSADGRLVVVTPTSGGPMSSYFALILASTEGCRDLPSIATLEAEFESAGFAKVRRERLIPGDSVWGIALRARELC